MSSSFNGVDLFGSGPHRIKPETMGQQMIPQSEFSGGVGWYGLGAVPPVVTVEGRLVGASEAAVRSQLEAIQLQLITYPTPGPLVNDAGHTWTEMSFGRFVPAGPMEYGRVVSLAYTAWFYRLIP